jgi:hypothetical protein
MQEQLPRHEGHEEIKLRVFVVNKRLLITRRNVAFLRFSFLFTG